MSATGDLGGRRGHALAIEIKPTLLPVCCPIFLKSRCRLGGGDSESSNRQDHGANADVRLRAFANVPALRTLEDRRADVSLGPNSLKHRVQIVAQFDDCVEGHTLMPLGAQPLNHFWKPYSLRVTGGHVWTIVVLLRERLLGGRFGNWPRTGLLDRVRSQLRVGRYPAK